MIRIAIDRCSCECDFCGKKVADVRIIGEKRAYGYDFTVYMCVDCARKTRKALEKLKDEA